MPSGKIALIGVAVLSTAGAAFATPWVTMGPRAMGMGGAYTAIAEGPLGAYYNPGALGQIVDNPSGEATQVSGRYEITGSVLEGANDVNQVAGQCRQGTAACSQANIDRALRKLASPTGEGVTAEGTGGVNFKFGRLAVFANNFSFRGATPQVDFTNTAPGTFANNQSSLRVRGASFYEFGAGYGREILDTGVFVGLNAKGIIGRSGYTDFFAARENPEAGSVLRNYDRSTRIGFMPAIDVGLLWDVRSTFPDAWMRPRIGFVGRNVNAPRFKAPARAEAVGDSGRLYSLQGQSRMGVAVDPLPWWTLASDFDITDNLTMLERYTSQLFSAGTEVRLLKVPGFAFPLRGGVSKNMAQGNSGALWSAGFGVQASTVFLDIAAQIPSRWHRVQSVGSEKRIPEQFGVSAQVAILFGGLESIGEPDGDSFAPPRRAASKPGSSPATRDPFSK